MAIAAISSAEPEAEAPEKTAHEESFIPADNLGKFVAERLDLSTFRNSFGPRREPGQRHFKDFGLPPTKTTETVVEIDTDDWFYAVHIIRRTDENGDGIEDLVVRFVDDFKTGSYNTSKTLLLTRLETDGNLVALAFTLNQYKCTRVLDAGGFFATGQPMSPGLALLERTGK